MRFSDTMLGAILLAFATGLAGFTQTLPAIPGQQYGAATFPFLIAIGFGTCGVGLVLRGWRKRLPAIQRADWTRRPAAIPAVLISIGLVVAFVVFSERLGFIPIMALLLFVLLRLLRVPWGQTIGLVVSGTLLLDLVFRGILLVPLPFGIVPHLPW